MATVSLPNGFVKEVRQRRPESARKKGICSLANRWFATGFVVEVGDLSDSK